MEEEVKKQENHLMEDLGSYSASLVLSRLKDCIQEMKNCTIKFYNKRTDATHMICHHISEQETKVDENGVKWKRIS